MKLGLGVFILAPLLAIGCTSNNLPSNSPLKTQQADVSGYWNLTLQTTKYDVKQNFSVLFAPYQTSNDLTLEFLGLPTPFTNLTAQPLYWCAPVDVQPLSSSNVAVAPGAPGAISFQLLGFQGDAFSFTGTVNGSSMSGSFGDSAGCTNGDSATWQAVQTSSDMNLAGTWQFTSQSEISNIVVTGSGVVQQNGSVFSGTLNLIGSPCADAVQLSGSVSETTMSGQLQEGAQAVNLTGTIYGNLSIFTSPTGGLTVTGTYKSPSGGCLNGDQGTWSASKT
jgi:hypothetical protein